MEKLENDRIAKAIAGAEASTSGEIRVFVQHGEVADPVGAAREQFELLVVVPDTGLRHRPRQRSHRVCLLEGHSQCFFQDARTFARLAAVHRAQTEQAQRFGVA